MIYRVRQPVQTISHYFSVGDLVDAVDFDGPVSVEDWLSLGLIEPVGSSDEPAEEPPAAVAEDPPHEDNEGV